MQNVTCVHCDGNIELDVSAVTPDTPIVEKCPHCNKSNRIRQKRTDPSRPKPKIRRVVRPLFDMVLIRQDEKEDVTEGGILLPDSAKQNTLTGTVATMPDKMKENRMDYPFEEGDKVIYDIRQRVPIKFDPRNKYYLVEYTAILGVVIEEDIDPNEPEFVDLEASDA